MMDLKRIMIWLCAAGVYLTVYQSFKVYEVARMLNRTVDTMADMTTMTGPIKSTLSA